MSILTISGRTAMAEALIEQPIHMAWGVGEATWDNVNPPNESVDAIALVEEVGRRAVFEKRFVVPDDDGDIVVPNGRFSFSDIPTRNVYFSFKLDFEDAADKIIRELAVYTNTETDSALPPGQKYFLGTHITNQGILLLLENITPVYRNAATRETFEFVVTL
jgi:hypothetical protein